MVGGNLGTHLAKGKAKEPGKRAGTRQDHQGRPAGIGGLVSIVAVNPSLWQGKGETGGRVPGGRPGTIGGLGELGFNPWIPNWAGGLPGQKLPFLFLGKRVPWFQTPPTRWIYFFLGPLG